MPHHVGICDYADLWKLFCILDGPVAEVGYPGHLVGDMVGADWKDDEGLAVGVQAGRGPLIHINDMIRPLRYSGLYQFVHVDMCGDAT